MKENYWKTQSFEVHTLDGYGKQISLTIIRDEHRDVRSVQIRRDGEEIAIEKLLACALAHKILLICEAK